MEFRKLINFGKTSHVVSIPKAWLLKNKLNKGDTVSLQEVDGNLLLSPNTGQAKKEPKEIVINVDNKDKSQIQRELMLIIRIKTRFRERLLLHTLIIITQ
jgi:antitoxin component of MazEF toxin-antitoxin module